MLWRISVVVPIRVSKVNPNLILGYLNFNRLYSNIFICTQKNSGKINVINTILLLCINENTIMYIFSSTHEKDENWIKIKKSLTKHKIDFKTFMDVDQVPEIINKLDNPKQTPDIKDKNDIASLFSCIREKPIIEKKHKYEPKKPVAPECIFIFDDMSAELCKEDISCLLKKHRHYKCKVILSSQYPINLNPLGRN